MLLAQRMAADRVTGDAEGPSPDELAEGGNLKVMAALAVALQANTRAVRASRAARPEIPWEACHPIPLSPLASNAAGWLGQGDERWTPPAGFAWHVMWIAEVLAAGATSWALYRTGGTSASAAYQVISSTVSGLFEPRGLVLMPGEYLAHQAVGGGVTVNGQAIEVALDWLPAYLM